MTVGRSHPGSGLAGPVRPAPARRASPRRGGRAYVLTLAGVAAALFVALAAYLRWTEAAAGRAPAVREQLDAQGRPRPLAEVAAFMRSQKLVTVEIDTNVTAAAAHRSWRGDVSADVTAPAKLLYGVDLSELRVESLSFSPMLGQYLVRVPAPERIATEVRGQEERTSVELGWSRLRSRAGEYYLGLARRSLYDEARRLSLSPEEARRVREATRESVADLVRRIVGERAAVTVHFEDAP